MIQLDNQKLNKTYSNLNDEMKTRSNKFLLINVKDIDISKRSEYQESFQLL